MRTLRQIIARASFHHPIMQIAALRIAQDRRLHQLCHRTPLTRDERIHRPRRPAHHGHCRIPEPRGQHHILIVPVEVGRHARKIIPPIPERRTLRGEAVGDVLGGCDAG
jgi:hypothetical protein